MSTPRALLYSAFPETGNVTKPRRLKNRLGALDCDDDEAFRQMMSDIVDEIIKEKNARKLDTFRFVKSISLGTSYDSYMRQCGIEE